MSNYDYDLFVLGAGSGGVRAARMAASLGKKVAIAEKGALGGTCVNVGCIPKKLFSYAAHYSDDLKDASGYGWPVTDRFFDWGILLANKNEEIKRLNGIYENLLKNAGAKIMRGHALLAGEHDIVLNEKSYSAEKILVAVGGKPEIPDFPGSEHAISSDDAFFLNDLPEKVTLVGGGYIAVEFASIFNGLGCETSQLYRGPLFLRGFDIDARYFLADQIRKNGIDLKFETSVVEIRKQNSEYRLLLSNGDQIQSNLVMYATGRSPNVANLGLESAGVITDDANAIIVDENYRTNIESIYALGDVTNRVNLTPVAIAEAMSLVSNLYGDRSKIVNYKSIPSAVFSLPNLATVGYTEEDARKLYEDIDIFASSFTPLKHTLTDNNEKCFMKLVVDKKTDQVIGAHMVGAEAGESIQGIAIAIKAGATKKIFDETIGIHPTSGEEWVTMRESVQKNG